MPEDNKYYYRIYGMRLVSDREISHLLTEERARLLDEEEGIDNSDISTIYISKGVPEAISAIEAGKWDMGEKESYLSNTTCWIYVKNGEEIRYELKPDGEERKLNNFLLGFGMSLLAFQRDYVPVHSSCLLKDGKAILISGDSGAGKSTTTAEYINKGYTLMADDITFVRPGADGMPMAYPAFPYQKLCRNEVEKRHAGEEGLIYIDESRDKFLVPWRGYYTPNPRPVKGIVYLCKNDVEKVIVEKAKGFEKFFILSKSIYMRRLVGERVHDKSIGEKILWLASKTPVIVAVRPMEKDTIKELVSLSMELVGEDV